MLDFGAAVGGLLTFVFIVMIAGSIVLAIALSVYERNKGRNEAKLAEQLLEEITLIPFEIK